MLLDVSTESPDNSKTPPDAASDEASGAPAAAASNDQVLLLTTSVAAFAVCPAESQRRQLIFGFFALCGAVGAAAIVFGAATVSTATFGLWSFTVIGYILVAGATGKDYLYTRLFRFALRGGIWDWVVTAVVLAVVLVVLVNFSMPKLWFSVALAALGISLSLHLVLDRQLEAQRRQPVRQVEQMLKELRREGASDEGVRRFVCEKAGEDWESFYEAMFGYDAKLVARQRWSDDELGRPRRKHKAWRDEIIRWLDRRRRLSSKKAPAPGAAANAAAAAQADGSPLVDAKAGSEPHSTTAAAAVAAANQTQAPMPPPSAAPSPKSASGKAGAAATGPDVSDDSRAAQRPLRALRWPTPMATLLGARIRFLIGVILVGACVLWMQQNDWAPWRTVTDQTRELIDQSQQFDADDEAPVDKKPEQAEDTTAKAASPAKATRRWQHLQLPWLPKSMQARVEQQQLLHWFNHLGVGVAGLILIFSSFFRGMKIAFFVYPAAAAAMFGHHWGIPAFWVFSEKHVGMAIGLVLFILGGLFGTVRE